MKTFKILCLSLIPIIGTSCGNQTDRNSSGSNIPGEDSSIGLLLGQGHNNVTSEVLGHCVQLGNLKTQSGQSTGALAEYRVLEITSESQLRESLNVDASGSLKFGIAGGGSARMSFAKSVNKNSKSRYLMVHSRVGNQLELASSFTLVPSAQALLENKNHHGFTKHCGNEFVYGRRTGGEFFAVFEYEFSDSEEERKFSAAISASGLAWKASTNINEEMHKFNMNARVHIKMIRFGGDGSFPEVPNLEAYARNFPKMVESIKGAPVTLELLTKSYEGVEPLAKTTGAPLLQAQKNFINTLARQYEAVLETFRTLIYIRTNLELFEMFNSEYLESKEKEFAAYINIVKAAAERCYINPSDISLCKLPEVAMPSVNLPNILYSNKESICEEMRKEAYAKGVISYKELLEWQEYDYIPMYKNPKKPEKGLVGVTYCEFL